MDMDSSFLSSISSASNIIRKGGNWQSWRRLLTDFGIQVWVGWRFGGLRWVELGWGHPGRESRLFRWFDYFDNSISRLVDLKGKGRERDRIRSSWVSEGRGAKAARSKRVWLYKRKIPFNTEKERQFLLWCTVIWLFFIRLTLFSFLSSVHRVRHQTQFWRQSPSFFSLFSSTFVSFNQLTHPRPPVWSSSTILLFSHWNRCIISLFNNR